MLTENLEMVSLMRHKIMGVTTQNGCAFLLERTNELHSEIL